MEGFGVLRTGITLGFSVSLGQGRSDLLPVPALSSGCQGRDLQSGSGGAVWWGHGLQWEGTVEGSKHSGAQQLRKAHHNLQVMGTQCWMCSQGHAAKPEPSVPSPVPSCTKAPSLPSKNADTLSSLPLLSPLRASLEEVRKTIILSIYFPRALFSSHCWCCGG